MRRSADQLCEHIGVDIAARKHDDDILAARIDVTGQKCREADRAAGLDHQFQLPERKSDRDRYFRDRTP